MPKFHYKARDAEGKIFTGTSDGGSVDEIVDQLAEKKQTPISIDELNFDGTKKGETFYEKVNAGLQKLQNKVPYKSVVFFTRQLATMVEAGVPLAQALFQLSEAEKQVFKRTIRQVADDISMGSTFSDAISRHPGAFSNMYVSVILSGEISGSLDKVLDQMATYMENVQALKQKVAGAMRYPLFIAGFVLLMVIGILWKLVPVFENMYASFGRELPRPTQILIQMSHIVQTKILFIFVILILIVLLFRAAMTNNSFQTFIHKYILFFPVFGMILKKNIWATFCRTMALLMDSGTPILQAIEISGAVVGNKMYSNSLEAVYQRLRTGDMLSQTLKDSGVFPVLITQLTATGEEAGKVDDLLRKAAEFYEREIRVTVDSLAAIIEPFLIIILGAIVGSILFALYLPIFNIGKLLT
jgi:type IV pilus assembly protein PilC